jgi:uncharacterized membrane protein YjjP (DUF1212 family)
MDVNENVLVEINRNELPFKSWLAMAWALFWRSLITTVGAVICGALAGGVLGFIVGLVCEIIKFPFVSIKVLFQIFGGMLGFGVGFLFIIVQLKWFYKANFKDFRIAILKKNG